MEYIKGIKSQGTGIKHRFNHVNLNSIMIYDGGNSKQLLNPFDLVNGQQNSFQGWACSAGSNGITINFDGFAYAGNCRVQKLGRIDQFEILDQWITCPRKWCKTAADIPLDKRYIEPESETSNSASAQARSTQL
jgi:hypothetical protein